MAPILSALRRLRQGDHLEFEASLTYELLFERSENFSQKKKKKNKKEIVESDCTPWLCGALVCSARWGLAPTSGGAMMWTRACGRDLARA